MKKEKYIKIVNKHKPKSKYFINGLSAFIVGGLMGVLGNFLVQFYSYQFNLSISIASILMIITLIFFACLFTALGVFDRFVKVGKMGLIIPITGFAHSMQSSALDYKNEGFIYGIGSNIFKLAGSVLLYGVVFAIIFGALRIVIMGG